MPTRSASFSLERVKLICCCMAAPCAIETAPNVASLEPVAAPIRMAARMPAIVAMLWRPCERTRRAMWRWVTCAISCASTPASCASLRVASTSP